MKAYYNARIQKIENYNNYYLEDKNDGLKVIDNFINLILNEKR